MGMTKVNDKAIVTPADEMKVEDLKELAGIPEHEVLYEPASGRVFNDRDVVPTNHNQYGVVTDWERG